MDALVPQVAMARVAVRARVPVSGRVVLVAAMRARAVAQAWIGRVADAAQAQTSVPFFRAARHAACVHATGLIRASLPAKANSQLADADCARARDARRVTHYLCSRHPTGDAQSNVALSD